MKMYLSLLLCMLLMVLLNTSYSQYISHYLESDKIKVDTLIDKINGGKFVIDKNRIFITAIDKNGKLLWKTDPAMDNVLEKYRTDRPTIMYFAFSFIKEKRNKEVIWITYNNTQFGYLDKENGKFIFVGQD